MKKTCLVLFALGFVFPTSAKAESSLMNVMNNMIINTQQNIRKSAEDLSSRSKETRKEWGKNNEYHDIYSDTYSGSETNKVGVRDSKYYEPEKEYRDDNRTYQPANLVNETTPKDDNYYEHQNLVKEIERDEYYQPSSTPSNMEVKSVRDLGEAQEAIEVDPYDDGSWR